MQEPEDLWVFAYGSLMWRPDFPFLERHRARLNGYHRALCITSHHWRGTVERPGLVLGLDRGGSCIGIVFRVAANHRTDTLEALRARELISGVYNEVMVEVGLADGTRYRAVTYVADRRHVQYAGRLDRTAMLEQVRQGVGAAGPNIDYVRNTQAHLASLGIADPALAWILAAFDAPDASAPSSSA